MFPTADNADMVRRCLRLIFGNPLVVQPLPKFERLVRQFLAAVYLEQVCKVGGKFVERMLFKNAADKVNGNLCEIAAEVLKILDFFRSRFARK
jgi:hypothetical protein